MAWYALFRALVPRRRQTKKQLCLGVALVVIVGFIIWGGRQEEKDPLKDEYNDSYFYSKDDGPMFGTLDKNRTKSGIKPSSKSMIQSDTLPKDCLVEFHAFYYAWYGNPQVDGIYQHWNHKYLAHWDANIAKKYQTGQHSPPSDIASLFYPSLGAYSSRDEAVIDQHVRWSRDAGVDVLVLSWYPVKQMDPNAAVYVDAALPLLNAGARHNVKVAFHVEPFDNRNAVTINEAIREIIDNYGKHPAFYRDRKSGKPVIYFYDSYQVDPSQWRLVFGKDGNLSLRGSYYDVIAIGLVVEVNHLSKASESGFDGVYTYFGSRNFVYSSKRSNWKRLAASARSKGMLFVPSVSPGYDDTRVRPWNPKATTPRDAGASYLKDFEEVQKIKGVEIVSITSFNEWHEGTQIEPAMKYSGQTQDGKVVTYDNYGDPGETFYLDLTKQSKRNMCHSSDH